MSNNTTDIKPVSESPLLSQGNEFLEGEEQPIHPLLRWWYHWTSIPNPPTHASFVKREAARRSHLVSVITFLFIIMLVILILPSVMSPDPFAKLMLLFLIVTCSFVLFVNRNGMSKAAGTILVIAAQIILTTVIFTTLPFYEMAIDLYSLYIVIDLLAASLLPKGAVFLIAAINCFLIWGSLTYQPKTSTMVISLDQNGNYWNSLLLQIVLQMIVAGTTFAWVNSTTKALRRADKAEMIAALEHQLSQQRVTTQQEKQELEDSILQLVKVYVDGTKSQLTTKVPYPPAKVLWPLVGVLNALCVRLHKANEAEQDLQNLEQAIISYTEILRTAQQFRDQPLPPTRTQTVLDPLIVASRQLHARMQSHNP